MNSQKECDINLHSTSNDFTLNTVMPSSCTTFQTCFLKVCKCISTVEFNREMCLLIKIDVLEVEGEN